jgi:SAM-dependent methyltransferase
MRALLAKFGELLHRVLVLGCATEHTFSRFKMYENIRKAAADKSFAGPALSISHSRHLIALLGVKEVEVVEANYPEVSISHLPHPDAAFGLVVSDQVFEHVDDLPSNAMRESLRVLRPGGWALHTTCFCTAYHGPGDYWLFTAEGLRSLALRTGATEAISGTEGHPVELLINLLGWTRLGVPKARWHPLRWLANRNRPSYGMTVWVLARK